jgi:PAS domain S-box-containing protein
MARVLILEERLDSTIELQATLESFGYQVTERLLWGEFGEAIAPSPAFNLSELDWNGIDLLLIDIQDNPDAAFTLIHPWRKLKPTVPLVYLTPPLSGQMLQRAIALQPVEVLVKPYSKAQLHSSLTLALHRAPLIESQIPSPRLEAYLHASTQEFQALVEHAPDVIARFAPDLRYLYINPTLEKVTGIPSQAFIGRTNLDLFMPEALVQAWHGALTQALHTKAEQSTEFDLITSDGVRSYQVRIVPETDLNGQVESLLSVARDVTEYKRAEAQLRQQAEREKVLGDITQRIHRSLELQEILNPAVLDIRRLLRTNRVVIYQFAPDWSGHVIVESVESGWPSMANQPLHDPCLIEETCIVPYAQGQISNTPDIHQAGFAPCYVELLDRYAVQANLIVPILLGPRRLWGLLAVQHCESARVWSPEEVSLLQQIAAQMAIAIQQSNLYQQVQQLNANLEQQVRDRTAELQQAINYEATLKRITDRVRDSFDQDQILQTVVSELALAVDAVTCDVALYDLEQQISTICYEYTSTGSHFQGRQVQMKYFPEGYQQLLAGHLFQFCPYPAESSEHAEARLACPIVDDQGVLGDIWLLKAAADCFSIPQIRLIQQVANQCAIALRQSYLYQAVQGQVEELERLNQMKDDFLSTVSHELRTPMSNIKMALHMLRIVLEPTGLLADETLPVQRYMQILQDECQRETSLINDLLNLARLESGTHVLTLSTIYLNEWLTSLIQPFEDRCHQQNQRFVMVVPESMPPLHTDVTHLERIVTELLTNACKYTPAEETIELRVESLDFGVSIRIRNSGVEIAHAELERIFDKFYRVPQSDRWQHGGTGLGLALVKRMLEDLKGSMEVSSQGGWTEFWLLLPWRIGGEGGGKREEGRGRREEGRGRREEGRGRREEGRGRREEGRGRREEGRGSKE